MKRFCFNSGFPFFWYRRIVRRTIVNQIRCCVPGSARLFLLRNLSTSLRAATSVEATASTTSTPWNTLRYNLMWWALWPNNATMFYHNLSPNFEYSQFFFPISFWLLWQQDHPVICTRRINSEKGQNYDVHYAPHISLISLTFVLVMCMCLV